MTLYAGIIHASEIQDGPAYVIHSNHLTDNFNAIISDFGDRLSLITGTAQTIAGLVNFTTGIKTNTISELTLNSGVTAGGVVLKAGTVVLAGTPTVNGQIGYASNQFQGYRNGALANFLMVGDASSLPTGYRGSAPPVYVNSNSFTVASIRDRDSTDAQNIVKAGTTTVSASSIGLNAIAQGSANLTGTVTVTASSTTVTFSTSQTGVLQIGDVITTAGGQSRRLASGSGTAWVSESTFLSTETAVTVKRGGRAPNTHFNLYATTDGTTPGLILATRNAAAGDTLVDFPTGYTFSRQQAFSIRTDASGNILPFTVGVGWPYRPEILYQTQITYSSGASIVAGTNNVLNAGVATTATTISAASLVPPISRLMIPNFLVFGRPASYSFRETGTTPYTMTCGDYNGGNSYNPRPLAVNASQQFDYIGYSVTGPLYVDADGFVVTEVP